MRSPARREQPAAGQLDRFTCEEAFRRLDDFLDRELSTKELARVQRHLDTCAACAREFAFEAQLLSGLRRRLREVAAPNALISRIAHLIEDRQDTHG